MVSLGRSGCRAHALASLRFIAVGMLTAAPIAETALGQPAVAAQGERVNELVFWAGYGDSDNIGRATIPVEGTYRSIGLFGGLQRSMRRLDAGVNSDLEYRAYSDDAFEDETIGSIDANALVYMVVDRLAWNFDGSLSEGQQDPFAARGPGNRETIKELTTGPRLDVPFGRTSFGVGATRSVRRYEESTQIDNDNDSYELALSRQVRPTTNFALVAASSETEYENESVLPHQFDQLFVRVNKTLRRGALSADVGTNEMSSGTDSRRDPLLDFAWDRLLGTRSSVRVAAAQQFMDAGTYQGMAGETLISTDPFEQESFSTDYSLNGERTTATIGVSLGKEDYAGGSALDNDYQSTNLSLGYRAAARLDIGLRYERYERESPDTTGLDASHEDRVSGVWLNWLLRQRISIAFNVSRYEATGLQALDDTRSEIRIAYSPTGHTSRALASVGR